ncbi:GntR family transcriptional regulator [Brachybacterium sp. AOP43-C2-M15]|uniref:GntR family transcriptional regulator n=1 Tax=Brachybacterium sp. AOP43-C2-M15 TaxID=3457661 RepID=UPI0040345DAC
MNDEASAHVDGCRAPESVYEALRTRIIQHDLEPGARISIAEEAARLGVSQTPVREALHRLEGDDLVVRSASRGYDVTSPIGVEGLRSLFEVRLLLEPWAARQAATDRLSNPAPRLRGELEELSSLHGAGRAVQAQRAAGDQRFHRWIVEATGNHVMAAAFERLHAHVHVFRLYQTDAEGHDTHGEHTAILEAVEACDPEAAEAAMRAHLLGAFSRLSSGLPADAPPLRSTAARARLR